MPKAKPDQVVVHRIELQEKERDMLEAAIAGRVVRDVAVPLAVTAGVGSAAYIGYKAAKAAFGWTEDIVETVKEDMQTVADSFVDTPLVWDETEQKKVRDAVKPTVGKLFQMVGSINRILF